MQLFRHMDVLSKQVLRPMSAMAIASRGLCTETTPLGKAQKVTVNGVSIYTIQNGDQGTPVVCLPGAIGTAETDFPKQLQGLSGAHQVVSFDPRGYGKSRPPRRYFPVDFYEQDANDACAVMETLGHQSFNVVGWSDGAISSVMLAALYPEKVQKLVMFGGNAYFTEEDVTAFEQYRDIETAWSKRMKETHLPVYGDDMQPMWNEATDAWVSIFKDKGGDVCMTQAKSIKCPTLVLHGVKDPICLIDHPQWFHENIPGARLKMYPEGKHNLHIRFADEVNKDILDFLA